MVKKLMVNALKIGIYWTPLKIVVSTLLSIFKRDLAYNLRPKSRFTSHPSAI